jgi:hypothetical protein
VVQKSANWLVKCTLKYVGNLLLTKFTKNIRNEIFHVQCATHNAVIPLYELTGRFKSEHYSYYETMFQVN